MKIRVMRVIPILLAGALLTGCTSTIVGSPVEPKTVGTVQSGGPLEVTLVSYVDPAPVYLANQYDTKPEDGHRLVAAQFRIHNTGKRDYLVDPITEADLTAGGKDIDTSSADTSAGVMLDQVSLSPGQTVLGYVTFDVPADAPATEVRYEPMRGTPMTWQVGPGGKPTPPAPWPNARYGAHDLGGQATITGDGGQLTAAATKLTDPATPQAGVDVGEGRHVVQVDFVVVGNGVPGDPELRIMTLFDAADQVVRAHIYSMEASVERPLSAGVQTTWPVQFVVPDGFVPDHVSFRPEFGDTTTTTWALT